MRLLLLCFRTCVLLFIPPDTSGSFNEFSKTFVTGYQSLKIPQLELSYVSGLEHIGSAGDIEKQNAFFSSVETKLHTFKINELTVSQHVDYELIAYETRLNRERLELETQWIKNRPANITANGIINVPNGKAWYAYLLKRWVSDDITPDQIYQFGLGEVERVKKHIEAIRAQTGMSEDEFYKHLNDPSFFITDSAQVKQYFEQTRQVIYANLHKLFTITDIAPLQIARGTRKALAQTPGYYDSNTFYYNLFDKPFNKRQVDWLFIHEAVPGHHYQASIIAQTKVLPVQQLFFYIGFAEGWAAYTEELGKQLGVYKTPYDELGKWEWDIVRSVRVPLDVGLNYYGWTDEQALAFWKKKYP